MLDVRSPFDKFKKICRVCKQEIFCRDESDPICNNCFENQNREKHPMEDL